MAGVGVSTVTDFRHRQLLLPFTVNCTHAHTSQLNIVRFLGMSRWLERREEKINVLKYITFTQMNSARESTF
jgi:hypothetical protein